MRVMAPGAVIQTEPAPTTMPGPTPLQHAIPSSLSLTVRSRVPNLNGRPSKLTRVHTELSLTASAE